MILQTETNVFSENLPPLLYQALKERGLLNCKGHKFKMVNPENPAEEQVFVLSVNIIANECNPEPEKIEDTTNESDEWKEARERCKTRFLEYQKAIGADTLETLIEVKLKPEQDLKEDEIGMAPWKFIFSKKIWLMMQTLDGGVCGSRKLVGMMTGASDEVCAEQTPNVVNDITNNLLPALIPCTGVENVKGPSNS